MAGFFCGLRRTAGFIARSQTKKPRNFRGFSFTIKYELVFVSNTFFDVL